MMRKLLILAITVLLGACSPSDGSKVSEAFALVSEVNVKSMFRTIETLQGVRMTEKDGFARTLAELKGEGYSTDRQFDDFVAAQMQGKAWKGYVFHDLTRNETSGMRYGLSAIPETPSSGPSYLLLIDLAKVQVNAETGASNGIGAEMYKTTTAPDPGERWPSASELAGWEPIRRLSPQEGLQAAQELKQKYEESRQ